MHDENIKKEVEIFFKTNNTTIAQTSKRFKIPYTTIKAWVDNDQWVAGSAIENIATTKKEVVTKNFDIITKKAKENIGHEIVSNLGVSTCGVDRIVLDSLISESSEAVLLQAMSLNHINKSLALNASIAKNALLSLNESDDGSMQSKMAIIACSEKVSKIFNDLKTSLYGRETTINNNGVMNYDELSEGEIIELLNRCDSEN